MFKISPFHCSHFHAKAIGESGELVNGQPGADDPWLLLVRRYCGVPPQASSLKTPGLWRRSPKQASIILVGLDVEQQAVVDAAKSLHAAGKFWLSDRVHLAVVWAGPLGVLSAFSRFFAPCELPFIVAVDPPQFGARAKIRGIFTVRLPASPCGIPSTDASTPQIVAPTSPSDTPQKVPWHRVPPEQRKTIINGLARVIAANDAPLVLRSVVEEEYPNRSGTYMCETELQLHAERRSSIALAGTAFSPVVKQMADYLCFLGERTTDSSIDIEVYSPSPPPPLCFDPVSTERRLRGQLLVATCLHCAVAIDAQLDAHHRCLHCPPRKCAICCSCFEALVHPQHHITVLWTPTTTARHAATLWGPGNVNPLPVISGRVVSNALGVHQGIYCDHCKECITGHRWKCCCCHDFDLCNGCLKQSLAAAGCAAGKKRSGQQERGKPQSATHAPLHPADHLLMYISCAPPGDCAYFLSPQRVGLETLVTPSAARSGS